MTEHSRKELLRLPIQPLWSQMDTLGHINNAVYFTYCEQARIVWLEQMGYGSALTGKSPVGPVIINASCTFHKAVIYPAELIVVLSGGEVGRSSFMTYYEIIDARTEGILYTTGSSKIVWVDYLQEKSLPLPDDIRQVLA